MTAIVMVYDSAFDMIYANTILANDNNFGAVVSPEQQIATALEANNNANSIISKKLWPDA